MTRDQGAANGQQTYAPIGRCTCGDSELLHALSETTKKRGACSNSNCGCRRYAAEEVAAPTCVFCGEAKTPLTKGACDECFERAVNAVLGQRLTAAEEVAR